MKIENRLERKLFFSPRDRPQPISFRAPYRSDRPRSLGSLGAPFVEDISFLGFFFINTHLATLLCREVHKPTKWAFGSVGIPLRPDKDMSFQNAPSVLPRISNLACLNRPLGFMLYSAFSLWNRALSLSAISSNIDRVTSSRSCHLGEKSLQQKSKIESQLPSAELL